jgi:uncharacterized phage-associated protein
MSDVIIDYAADYKAIDIAYCFLKIAHETDSFSNDISNMKLNKLVYFAQVMYVGAYRKALYKDDTRAWDYGPVIPPLYRLLKPFGAIAFSLSDQRIEEAFKLKKVQSVDDGNALSVINSVWNALKDLSAVDLSRMTHRKGSPWSEVYAKKPYDIIPLELMYAKRFGE